MKNRRKINRKIKQNLSFVDKILKLKFYLQNVLPYKILEKILPRAFFIYFSILIPIGYFFESLIGIPIFRYIFIKRRKQVKWILTPFVYVYNFIIWFLTDSVIASTVQVIIFTFRLIFINFRIFIINLIPINSILKLDLYFTKIVKKLVDKSKIFKYLYTAIWIRNSVLIIIYLFLFFLHIQFPGFMHYWPFSGPTLTAFYQFLCFMLSLVLSRRIRAFLSDKFLFTCVLIFATWWIAQDIFPAYWGFHTFEGFEDYGNLYSVGKVKNPLGL